MNNYIHCFKFGRLYYRFIKSTPLEAAGWTGESLANKLEELGYVKVITIQPTDTKGRWKKAEKRYVEVTGKHLTKKEFTMIRKIIFSLVLALAFTTISINTAHAEEDYLFETKDAVDLFRETMKPYREQAQIYHVQKQQQPPKQQTCTHTPTYNWNGQVTKYTVVCH